MRAQRVVTAAAYPRGARKKGGRLLPASFGTPRVSRPRLSTWGARSIALAATAAIGITSAAPVASVGDRPSSLGGEGSAKAAPRGGTWIKGHGSATVGGAGGQVITVTTLADSGSGSLRAALDRSGPRIVRFSVSGTITLKTMIKLRQPRVTIDGASAPGSGIQIRGESLEIGTNQVIIRHIRFRPGDGTADAPDDLDGLTIDGKSGTSTHHIVLDHIEALWGPDIGGLAILNNATDITVQHSILGGGLFRSRHHEANIDSDGHSYATNIVGLTPSTYPRRVTYYRNLITHSEGRTPRVVGVDGMDLVNNVIYAFHKGPYGNPKALNMVNNILRSGPAPAAVGLTQKTWIWRPSTSDDFPTVFKGSVYELGTVTDGFTGKREGEASIYASSPTRPLSVTPEPTAGLLDRVLSDVGAIAPRVDVATARILEDVRARTGRYLNGETGPSPKVTWP